MTDQITASGIVAGILPVEWIVLTRARYANGFKIVEGTPLFAIGEALAAAGLVIVSNKNSFKAAWTTTDAGNSLLDAAQDPSVILKQIELRMGEDVTDGEG